MFCGCPTTFGAPPNSQTCPICQGMPGTLPVINRRAVEFAVRTALAFECRVNAACRFARKHYYYPDMPKNYQISQYEEPLAEDGVLDIDLPGGARADPHPAPAPRGGRRQAGARGRLRRRAVEPRGLQPLGHAADGDGEPSRPALARGGRGVSQGLPRRAALHRRVRRQHGGGLAALRRQRLAAAARRDRRSAPRSRSRT